MGGKSPLLILETYSPLERSFHLFIKSLCLVPHGRSYESRDHKRTSQNCSSKKSNNYKKTSLFQNPNLPDFITISSTTCAPSAPQPSLRELHKYVPPPATRRMFRGSVRVGTERLDIPSHSKVAGWWFQPL